MGIWVPSGVNQDLAAQYHRVFLTYEQRVRRKRERLPSDGFIERAPQQSLLHTLPSVARPIKHLRHCGQIFGTPHLRFWNCRSADVLRKVCRFTCKRLFVSQRDHRIDARSATRWNVAGQNGRASQHKRYGGERYGISRPNSVEQV